MGDSRLTDPIYLDSSRLYKEHTHVFILLLFVLESDGGPLQVLGQHLVEAVHLGKRKSLVMDNLIYIIVGINLL